MKISNWICISLLLFLSAINTLRAAALSDYLVIERGLNYKVLQKTTTESGTNHIYRFTELATGMNYTNANGELVESSEQINVLQTGGAEATQGQHKAFFPANVYNGV